MKEIELIWKKNGIMHVFINSQLDDFIVLADYLGGLVCFPISNIYDKKTEKMNHG